MTPESLRVAVEDGVARVTVDRPEKLNALTGAMLLRLEAIFAELRADAAVRAVVVTGAGEKAFVAGADIGELQRASPLELAGISRAGQRAFDAIERLGKPVIAAVNGFALGGGLELALACHLRTAAATAKLGLPEVNLGILPGYGGTQRLPRLVGRGRALELMLSGAPVDAAEAHRIGLVNHVHEPGALLEETTKLARRLAEKAPVAVAWILDAVLTGNEQPLADGLALESSLFGLIGSTADTKEGLTAHLEKRKASFQGR